MIRSYATTSFRILGMRRCMRCYEAAVNPSGKQGFKHRQNSINRTNPGVSILVGLTHSRISALNLTLAYHIPRPPRNCVARRRDNARAAACDASLAMQGRALQVCSLRHTTRSQALHVCMLRQQRFSIIPSLHSLLDAWQSSIRPVAAHLQA
jgi:hypothetical protein